MIQMDEILKAFQRGESLTPLEALDRFGCFRLAAQVFSLKKLGYDIQTEIVQQNEKHFARYWLPASASRPTCNPIVKPQVAGVEPSPRSRFSLNGKP